MKIFDYEDFVPATRCSIAAAVLGAGALSAGASIFGANKAAGAQTSAAQQSIAAIRDMFNTVKTTAQPFIDAGTGALPNLTGLTDTQNPNSPLSALLRLVTPGTDQTKTLEATPGFQFSNTYGQKAVGNALAARGLGGPGGALARGGADYAEGLAGTQYTNIVQALLSSLTGGGNLLQNIVNSGTNALGTLTGAAGTASTGTASALTGMGNAQGGAATATGNAIGGFGNSISTAAILQKLLGGGGIGGGNPASGLYTGDPTLPGWNSAGQQTQGAGSYA